MIVTSYSEELKTRGHDECVDVTGVVQEAVNRASIRRGVAMIFVTGSTAGVTTIEYEPGLVSDLQAALRRLFPDALPYRHHDAPGEDNGPSHLRASCIGPSLSVPIRDGRLVLGTWQQIVLIDCDTLPRTRTYLIQLIGE